MTISAIARLRQRRLEYSATAAAVTASMPPIPSPVSRRHARRLPTPVAYPAPNMPAAMMQRHRSIVARRPILSPTPPRVIEPIAIPSSSIDRIQPSVPEESPQSLAMPGEAKLIASTSNPSSALSPNVTATATHWARPMRPCSMIALGVLAIDVATTSLSTDDGTLTLFVDHLDGRAAAASGVGLIDDEI